MRRSIGIRRIFAACLLAVVLLGGSAVLGIWDPSALAWRAGLFAATASIGDVIDELDGVPVYYNGPVGNVSGRNLAPDGYNLGLKYQCVEFVKRYYYEALTHKMPDPWGHAVDFFDPSLDDGAFNPRRGLVQYENGSAARPQRGDLLVFGGSLFNRYGHVAIVAEVTDVELCFIQQNPGPGSPSREARALEYTGTRWRVADDALLGWLRKP